LKLIQIILVPQMIFNYQTNKTILIHLFFHGSKAIQFEFVKSKKKEENLFFQSKKKFE